MTAYDGRSRAYLQLIAAERGLQVSGTKAAIAERLVTYDDVKNLSAPQLHALAIAEGIVLRKKDLADRKIEYVRKKRPVVEPVEPPSEGETPSAIETLEADLAEAKTQIAQLRSLVIKLTNRVGRMSKLVGDVSGDVTALRTELEEWSL